MAEVFARGPAMRTTRLGQDLRNLLYYVPSGAATVGVAEHL